MQQPSFNPVMWSYRNHTRYPRNLVPHLTKAYPWEPQRYDDNLADVRSRLCIENEEEVDLPTRDIFPTMERGDGKSETMT